MTKPLGEYGLDNYNCDKCGNTGYIAWRDDEFVFHSKECECMAKRRSIRRIQLSGMSDMLDRYTFENYKTPNRFRELVKQRAIEYTQDNVGWFYICGRSGSGKTHICTAICKALIDAGNEVYYMSWRDESVTLKALVTDAIEYEDRMRKLKTVKVLYIDDFLKGNCSPADLKLAFEILNARYNNITLRTIVSTEITLDGLLELDEALGGRFYERAYKLNYLLKAPKENYRLLQLSEDRSQKQAEQKNAVTK